MNHAKAFEIANNLVMRMRSVCERVEIGGSIRRGKADVKDIEIVAIPFFQTDMFGGSLLSHSLDVFPWERDGVLEKSGHKYKKVALNAGINLDVFIVTPPAQWGVQMVIRTGPSDFSHWIVTKRSMGGALPDYYFVKDGSIWDGRDGSKFNTPEEKDFFRLCGLKLIEPALREAKWTKTPSALSGISPKSNADLEEKR